MNRLTMSRRRSLSLVLVFLLTALPLPAQDTRHDAATAKGLVVSVSPEASEAGAVVLRKGGHAVDAAIATALALAVTYPPAGNIGGGGFMMVHSAASRETVCIEYRETAPLAATKDIFRKLNASSRGPLSVGVPGTVRGLALAHQRYGKRPWKELVQPAIQLAEDGFPVDAPLARSLNAWRKNLTGYDETLRVFFRSKDDGTPREWQAGDRLVQPDLARTLRVLADDGPDAFYSGRIADQLVAEMQRGGGLITKADLAKYQAHARKPVHGTYRGHDIFAPPPPSSGGIALVEMLNILETFDLPRQPRDSSASTHLFIEAMRRAYLDRARYVGDPAFANVPLERLTSKDYARELAASIRPDKATRSEELGRDILQPAEGPNTTHFSVMDAEGNAVSNTYTLQDSYGSFVTVSGAGFLLNNEMTDFNLQPGTTDSSGRIGTPANVVEPGKRMLSSQTPTIVLKDGRVRIVTGSPGGRTIINTVLGIVTAVIDQNMTARQAVDAPRLHHQWLPDVARMEAGRVTESERKRLEEAGHRLEPARSQGNAHSIVVDPETGLKHGAADKRISGSVSVE